MPTIKLLLLCSLVASAGCIELAEPASHLIPQGFRGEVSIIFSDPDGTSPEMHDGRRIYRIPPDGILRTQFSPTFGWSIPTYFYIKSSDNTRVSIQDGPSGSIPDTPESRSIPEIEILGNIIGAVGAPVPGKPGSFSSDAPCAVKYSSFFVGTRAEFLDRPGRRDMAKYLRRNPVRCSPVT